MLSHHPRFAVDITTHPTSPTCYRPHSAVDRRTEFGWLLIVITLTPRATGHHSLSSQRRPPSTATPLTVACARATPRCHTHPRYSSTEQRRSRPRPAVPAHSLHCSMTSTPSVCRNRVNNTNAPPTTTIIDMQQQRIIRLEELDVFCCGRVTFFSRFLPLHALAETFFSPFSTLTGLRLRALYRHCPRELIPFRAVSLSNTFNDFSLPSTALRECEREREREK